MGEVDYLTSAGHGGKQPKSLLRSEVVECLHDIVGKKGGRRAGLCDFVIAGDP